MILDIALIPIMPESQKWIAQPQSLALGNLCRLHNYLPVCELAERPTATLFPPKANHAATAATENRHAHTHDHDFALFNQVA